MRDFLGLAGFAGLSGLPGFLGYFALFALVHSLLADERSKEAARRAFGPKADRWYRAAYVILAVVMVLPLGASLVLHPGRTVYSAPKILWPLMVAGQLLAVLTAIYAVIQTDIFHFFGLRQVASRETRVQGHLVRDGLFCHVRNPLFLAGIAFIWLFPVMTLSLLAFNVAATVYFYLGALHEERTLDAQFGEEYRRYREQVPMFVPSLRCRR